MRLRNLKGLGVLARNYAFYRQHALLAATVETPFPFDSNSNFVITMASYPGRIHQVPAVYESLARQQVRPKEAYLVLSEEDFTARKVPRGIRRLEDRGVQIIWCRENPFAVKKLVEVWGRQPGCAVVAFDDDFIYSPDLLAVVKERAERREKAVLGFIGKEMVRKGQQLALGYRVRASVSEYSEPSRLKLQGGLGTWYQPGSLDVRFTNREAFTRIVPGRGSDMWFWAAAVAAGANQVCLSSDRHSRMFIPIPETRRTRPKDMPGGFVMEERFQQTVDYFGIREKLLRELRDVG